jgi:hypothetical protein
LVATAAIVVVAPRRTVAGVEITGDHEADRLHPTRHIADALDENLVVVSPARLSLRRAFPAGVLDAEEIEPLVVFVVAASDRRKILSAAPRQARSGAQFGL